MKHKSKSVCTHEDASVYIIITVNYKNKDINSSAFKH